MANLPNKTFLCNYNAKQFNILTNTIPKTSGQTFGQDMVLNASPSAYTLNNITVNGQYFEYDFGYASLNPFNRTGNQPLTIVAKTSKGFYDSGEHTIVCSRYPNINWLLFNPANTTGEGTGANGGTVFLHDNSHRFWTNTPYVQMVSDPNIYAIRVSGGTGYGKSFTDNTTFESRSVSFGSTARRVGFFTDPHTLGGFELWHGTFYWIYVSTEYLTDEEVQEVIDYNEQLPTQIEIVPNSLSFSYQSGSSSVNITTSSNWNASTNDNWITLSATAGTSGSTNITVSVSENQGLIERSGVITITDANSNVATISVSQSKMLTTLFANKVFMNGLPVNKICYNGEIVYQNIYIAEPEIPNDCLKFTLRNTTSGSMRRRIHEENYTLDDLSLQYSFDNETWNTWDYYNVEKIDFIDHIYLRGYNPSHFSIWTSSIDARITIYFEELVDVSGNIMSLIDYNNPPLTIPNDGCFHFLFANKIVNAKDLILPATSLTTNCYTSMFQGDIYLKTVPELPATTLANSCYHNMFYACSSLINVPDNLLPATTLGVECYGYMFAGCTSLIKAPELNATRLQQACYKHMFDGCSNLKYIKCLGTNVTDTTMRVDWVRGVSPTGIFVKAAGVEDWNVGNSGIPSGWTVIEE